MSKKWGGKIISHRVSNTTLLKLDPNLLPDSKRMPRWLANIAIGVLGALLCLVALVQVHTDLSEPSQCQTTYIRQDYKQIQLGNDAASAYPSYRLIAYTGDGLADPPAGRQGQTVPILFVHGHMGTHQQMRSLASETGRELALRVRRDVNLSYWLSWQAVDFGEELSALSARLLARQAGFVVACIKHMLAQHQSSGSGESSAPFRLLLVGYSMGGIVARAALRQLERDPEFDMSPVALLVTMGTPNRHFPSFMPPTAFSAVLASAHSAAEAAAAQGAGSQGSGWSLPTLAVTAGPGDMLVLEQLSGAPMGTAAALASWVQLSMQDVPGVWTRCNHKSIVSCNQLVRRLAPLLIDVAQLSSEAALSSQHGSMAAMNASSGAEGQQGAAGLQEQVLQLLRQRMSTNIARSLAAHAAPLLAGSGGTCSEGGNAARQAVRQPVAGQHGKHGPKVQEDAAWAFEELLPGQSISLSWRLSRLDATGSAGVLLLVHQAKPCRDFSVRVLAAAQGEAGEAGQAAELAGAAQPLPSLIPGVLQQAGGPGRERNWQEIWEGIDWLGNATWLLYVPVSALGADSKLELELTAPSGTGAVLVAQVLDHHPLDGPALLPSPFAGPLNIPAGSAAVKCYQLPPQWLFPAGADSAASPISPATSCPAGAGAAGSSYWAAQAAAVLVGTAPPLRLRVVSYSEGSPQPAGAASVACHLQGVVGIGADAHGPSQDVVRLGVGAVSLWRGGMNGRSLVLLTDPRCSHTLSVEWDVTAWLGVSLRHHAYALPSLCLALAMMAALGSCCGRRATTLPTVTIAAAAAAVVVAAWGSQHPQLANHVSGLVPWVGISVVEGSALFVLAQALLLAFRGSAKLSVHLLASATGRWGSSRFGGAAVAAVWAMAVVGAATVHPALSLLAGVLRLWFSLAAAGCCPASRGSKRLSSPTAKNGQQVSEFEQGGGQPTATGSALRRRLGAEAHAAGQQPCVGSSPAGQLFADALSPQQSQQGATSSSGSNCSSERPSHGALLGGLDWLLLYWFMLVLAAPGLLAWANTGHRAGIGGGFSTEAVALVMMGLHASWIAGQVRPAWASCAPTTGAQLEVAYLAIGFLTAAVTAVTGLWGYPYVAVYSGSTLTTVALFGGLWGAVQHSRLRHTYAE